MRDGYSNSFKQLLVFYMVSVMGFFYALGNIFRIDTPGAVMIMAFSFATFIFVVILAHESKQAFLDEIDEDMENAQEAYEEYKEEMSLRKEFEDQMLKRVFGDMGVGRQSVKIKSPREGSNRKKTT